MQIRNTVNTFLQSNTDFQTQCQKYIFCLSFIIAVQLANIILLLVLRI